MRNKKEFSIREEFDCGLVRLRCEESGNSCTGCYFDDSVDYCPESMIGLCTKYARTDSKDVIFVEVKGNDEE